MSGEVVKLWVVASDVGLNGFLIHGVYGEPPDQAEVTKFVTSSGISSWTGYSCTTVEEYELDGHLRTYP